ncbi:MAG TPA: pseudouridine synthase [Vicinamibacteria bacterium]|nr:pseudouridine synthase [Vicinamibacteria bacterium]
MLSLARALSKFGVCSRAEAARWIEQGRVRVDGEVVRWPQRRIQPARQRVEVDGVRVGDRRRHLVVALHKPAGYLTTRVDPGGRPTVYDLLGDVGAWVFPVGRLDRDSSGLIILTNDHRLGQRLTAPEHEVPKTYHARVRGVPGPEALAVLREGATLEDGTRCRPARVRALGSARGGATAAAGGSAWLEITLTEGKNRQVRRMCAAVGHEVQELVRVRIGGLALGELASGSWRRLSAEELARLQQAR